MPCCSSCQNLVTASFEFNVLVKQQAQLVEQLNKNTEVIHRFTLQQDRPNIVHEAIEGLETLLTSVKAELALINKNSSLPGSVAAIKSHVAQLVDTAITATKENLKTVTSEVSSDLRNINNEICQLNQLSLDIAASLNMNCSYDSSLLIGNILDEIRSLAASIAIQRAESTSPPSSPSLDIELNGMNDDEDDNPNSEIRRPSHLAIQNQSDKNAESTTPQASSSSLNDPVIVKVNTTAQASSSNSNVPVTVNNKVTPLASSSSSKVPVENSGWRWINRRNTLWWHWKNDWSEHDDAEQARKSRRSRRRRSKNRNNSNDNNTNNRNSHSDNDNSNSLGNINKTSTNSNNTNSNSNSNNNAINYRNRINNNNNNNSNGNRNNSHNRIGCRLNYCNNNNYLPPDRELLAAAKHHFSRPPASYRLINFQRGEILNPYPAGNAPSTSAPFAAPPTGSTPPSNMMTSCEACACRHTCFTQN